MIDFSENVYCPTGPGGGKDPTCSPGKQGGAGQTQTKAFKQWFGKSKVVDAAGKPLRVFHGTRMEFEQFQTDSEDEGFGIFDRRLGAHFAEDPTVTGAFSTGEYARLHDYAIDSYHPENSWYREGGKIHYLSDADADAVVTVRDRKTGSVQVWTEKEHGPLWSLSTKENLERYEVGMVRAQGRTLPVYLRIEKPLVVDPQGGEMDQSAIVVAVAAAVIPHDRQLFIDAATSGGWSTPEKVGEMWDSWNAGKPYGPPGKYGSYATLADFLDDRGSTLFNNGQIARRAKRRLMQLGYDGIKYRNTSGNEVKGEANPWAWIAFKPEQIKSASGNQGKFDPQDPIITHARVQQLLDTINAFCPTGKGGGKDNSCPPKHGTMHSLASRHPQVAKLLQEDAGVWEGYTIGEHTGMVLDAWKEVASDQEVDRLSQQSGIDLRRLMPAVLSLHDIGKPLAIEAGDRELQHEFTLPILRSVLGKEGFGEQEIKLAEALVGHDVFGDVLRGRASVGEGRRVLAKRAAQAGMDPQVFMQLAGLYYKADAISYPALRKTLFKKGSTKLRNPDFDALVGQPAERIGNARRRGYQMALNYFCKTGEGGGVDPTCKKGEVRPGGQAEDTTLAPQQVQPEPEKPRRPPNSIDAYSGNKLEIRGTGKNGRRKARDLTKYLNDQTLTTVGKTEIPEGGKPLSQDDLDKMDALAETAADEIERAYRDNPETADWYNSNLQQAVDLVAEKELPGLKDPSNRRLFSLLLAVTSAQQSVAFNLRSAVDLYKQMERGRRSPKVKGGGKAATAQQNTLNRILGYAHEKAAGGSKRGYAKRFRAALDEILDPTPDANGVPRGILHREYTLAEFAKQFGKKPTQELVNAYGDNGELVPNRVLGSWILGPKVGSFFQNLNGNRQTTTMDLWFARNTKKLRGAMFKEAGVKSVEAQTTRLESVIQALREKHGENLQQLANDIPRPSVKDKKTGRKKKREPLHDEMFLKSPAKKGQPAEYFNVEQILQDCQEARKAGRVLPGSELEQFLSRRYSVGETIDWPAAYSGGKKPGYAGATQIPPEQELNLACKTLFKGMNREDHNYTGTERAYLRLLMRKVSRKLEERGVTELQSADIQAVWWAYEKTMYDRQGVLPSRYKLSGYLEEARKRYAEGQVQNYNSAWLASPDLDSLQPEQDEFDAWMAEIGRDKLYAVLKWMASHGRAPEPTANVFCPTGRGGGKDPTCSPKGRTNRQAGAAKRMQDLESSTRRIRSGMREGAKVYLNPDPERLMALQVGAGELRGLVKVNPEADGPEYVFWDYQDATHYDVATDLRLDYESYHRVQHPVMEDNPLHDYRIDKDENPYAAEILEVLGRSGFKRKRNTMLEQLGLNKSADGRGTISHNRVAKLLEVVNAWCPTGPGGGKDNSCSPKSSGRYLAQVEQKIGELEPQVRALRKKSDALYEQVNAMADAAGGYDKIKETPEYIKLRDQFNAASVEASDLNTEVLKLKTERDILKTPPVSHPPRVTIAKGVDVHPDVAQALVAGLVRQPWGDESEWVANRYEYELVGVRGAEGTERVYEFKVKAKHPVEEEPEGATDEVPEREGYVYRGMSREEWDTSKKRGYLESMGGLNIGQEGLTFYGRGEVAHHYSAGFAHYAYTAVPGVPGVVVEVPRSMVMDSTQDSRIPGSEYAHSGRIPLDSVTSQFDVVATKYRDGKVDAIWSHGKVREGSRLSPSISTKIVRRQLTKNEVTANVGRWAFLTSSKTLEEFTKWLKLQLLATILAPVHPDNLESDAEPGETWLSKYIRQAYRQAMGRAYDDWTRPTGAIRLRPEAGAIYQAGGKAEFLRQSFGGPVGIERVKQLAMRSYTDLDGIGADLSRKISHDLLDGMVQGESPLEVGRRLNKIVSGYKNRGRTIARTETIRAHNEGALDAMQALGATQARAMVEWSTSQLGVSKRGYPSPCPLCAELEGMVLSLDEARGMLPRHPNSLPGDTIVQASGAVALVEARYTGNLVTVTTASGKRVSTTENHVFLTDHGFVPAHLLYKGLNLLDASGAYSAVGQINYDDRGVTAIGDVFKTLAPFASVEMHQPTAVDFHGDGKGMHEEVSIVRTDSVLWDELQAKLAGQSVEQAFPLIEFVRLRSLLALYSPVAEFLKRIASTFDRSMGICRDSLSLLLGFLLQPSPGSLGLGAQGDVGFKSASDDSSGTVELLRECLNAHPLLKQFDRFIDWERCTLPTTMIGKLQSHEEHAPFNRVLFDPQEFGDCAARLAGLVQGENRIFRNVTELAASATQRHPGFEQSISDYPAASSINRGQIVQGLARLVTTDKIIDVQVLHVSSLPVYDIQTQSSLIIANGITMSQCMCSWVPANVGEATKDQLRTKSRIQAAIDSSLRLEIPRKLRGKRNLERQRKVSDWAGARSKIKFTRPKAFVLHRGQGTLNASLGAPVLTGSNCGIGPGGFQQGNTCARGGGSGKAAAPKQPAKPVSKLPPIVGPVSFRTPDKVDMAEVEDWPMVDSKGEPCPRKLFAQYAIERARRKGYTLCSLRDEQGTLAAVMDYDEHPKAIIVDYLSARSGHGARMLAEICRIAGEKGAAVMLTAAKDARQFYIDQGMKRAGDDFMFTAEQALNYARKQGAVKNEEGEEDEGNTLTVSISKRLLRRAAQLGLITNVFCKTGLGGGVDPTCSPGGSKAGSGQTAQSKPPVPAITQEYIDDAARKANSKSAQVAVTDVKAVLKSHPKLGEVQKEVAALRRKTEAAVVRHKKACNVLDDALDRQLPEKELEPLALACDDALVEVQALEAGERRAALQIIAKFVKNNSHKTPIMQSDLELKGRGGLNDSQLAALTWAQTELDGAISGDYSYLFVLGGDAAAVRSIPAGKKQRSYFNGVRHGNHENAIMLEANPSSSTVAHELGHLLETDPAVYHAALGFLYKRVGKEPAEHMGGYEDYEVGREDKFRRAFGNSARYPGKHYKTNDTEIVSSGLEKLYQNPAKFARDDPEYFQFMLAVLSGIVTRRRKK